MSRPTFIADIHHVSINVADVVRAEAFYTEILGLEILPRPDFPFPGRWLDAGAGRQVHLIQTEHIPTDVGQHFAFRATDLDQLCAHLAEHSVKVSGPKPVGAGRQAFFHDPDGNRLEAFQDN
jgi:catechol 2,3-dioxygenase-like lactoylglutathione lyase family enzyme